MISYFAMVNAWSLAGSILNGTFEKDYPIMDKTKGRWTEEDEIRELDDYADTSPLYDPQDLAPLYEDTTISPLESDEYDIIHPEDDDGLIYENQYYGIDYMGDTMADVDDQRAHHFTNAYSSYNDGWTREFHKEQLEKMDYEPQRNHQYKYHEEEILKDIEEYVSRTYQGHYTGTKHEFRKVQTIDLMAARDIAAQFCQANILKYGSRYGSKDGRNKTDLMKVIHYAMLLLHFDGHYGTPSMSTGNIDDNISQQMP